MAEQQAQSRAHFWPGRDHEISYVDVRWHDGGYGTFLVVHGDHKDPVELVRSRVREVEDGAELAEARLVSLEEVEAILDEDGLTPEMPAPVMIRWGTPLTDEELGSTPR